MRLKLVLVTSLIGAAIGFVVSYTFLIALLGPWMTFGRGHTTAILVYLALSLPPIVTALFAAIFVYRHTAVRRKLQASLTAVLVLLICLGALTVFLY
jgi:hypothetical protein